MRPDYFLHKIRKNYMSAFVLLLICAAFYYKGLLVPDPDFGWHLRLGDIIRKTGISALDPFSYTMPSYPFVDHEWLTNVLISFLYRSIGMKGLLALFALIATGTVMIIGRRIPSRLRIFFVILAGSILVPFAGVRPQVIAWMFFALFIRALDRYEKGITGWFIPLGVLVWANSHGSFPLALVLLVAYFAAKLMRGNHLSGRDMFVLGGSAAATFITPYGWRSWWEVAMQMTDTGLRWSINEWMPMFFYFDLALLLFIALSIVSWMKLRRKVSLWHGLVFWIFLFAALSGIRHIPLFIIAAFPVVGSGLAELFELIRGPEADARKKMATLFLGVCILTCCAVQWGMSFWTYVKQGGVRYPERAVRYLGEHPVPGRLFSIYDWGGYLIWKRPGERVFIDGRMPSWRRGEAVRGESANAMKEYQDMMKNPSAFRAAMRKYHIIRVLLPKGLVSGPAQKPSFVNRWLSRWDPKQPNPGDFLRGMTKEYDDGTAVIYRAGAVK